MQDRRLQSFYRLDMSNIDAVLEWCQSYPLFEAKERDALKRKEESRLGLGLMGLMTNLRNLLVKALSAGLSSEDEKALKQIAIRAMREPASLQEKGMPILQTDGKPRSIISSFPLALLCQQILDVQSEAERGEKSCAYCGVEFVPRRPWAKYCGNLCRQRAYYRRARN